MNSYQGRQDNSALTQSPLTTPPVPGTGALRGLRAETYVNWCGHGQEIIPVPLPDGRANFVPALGEAR